MLKIKFEGELSPVERRLTAEEFEAEIARILRRAQRLRDALSGDATVERVWRKGYTERKIRRVRGHFMHVVRSSKPRLRVLKGGRP